MAFKDQRLPDLPRLSQEEVFLYLKAAKAGDKEARDRLINSNLRLISTMIRRFQGRGYEEEDLFQIGVIGLIKAIDRFDISYDVQFSTYAVPMIIGEIKRFLRDDGPLKVSRTYKDNLVQIRKAQERLQKELDREPTLRELEAHLGMPREVLTASLEAGCLPYSIHEALPGDDGSPLYRVDQLKSHQDDEEVTIKHLALEEMLEKLEPREREILRLRYFEDKTQSQIAERLGLSQVQISRLERAIIKKCREMLSEDTHILPASSNTKGRVSFRNSS